MDAPNCGVYHGRGGLWDALHCNGRHAVGIRARGRLAAPSRGAVPGSDVTFAALIVTSSALYLRGPQPGEAALLAQSMEINYKAVAVTLADRS